MITQDLRYHTPGSRLTADVCIVGAGPAGLVLAEELSGQGLKVLILESGDGEDSEDGGVDLNTVESVGRPRVQDQRLVRRRTIGGASQFWYGRVATLDPEDFEARAWVPHSGWPIDRAALLPYYARAAVYFGLPTGDNTEPAVLADLGVHTAGTDPRLLEDYFWLLARHGRFGDRPVRFGDRARALDLPGVVCVTNATVTQIVLSEDGGSVADLEVTAPDGRSRNVRPGITVLAAGGLENARLLLSSNRQQPSGVGNAEDQVGRYLMDHLRARIADVDPVDQQAVHALSAGLRRRRRGSTVSLRPGFALSSRLQRDRRVLNAASWVDWASSPTDPWHYLRNLSNLGAPRQYAGVAARGLPLLARGARSILVDGRMPKHEIESANIECWLEQAPRSDSRLTLSGTRDRYGMPFSRIDWRFGEIELATVRVMAETVRDEFARLGLPRVKIRSSLDDGDLELVDVAHPMGTTRMSVRSQEGVVDGDCRVHGLTNLFIAGGSVFPTGGHANPTHTILALAIRLADHLKAQLARPATPCGSPAAASDPVHVPAVAETPVTTEIRPLVLVTGASGKIGRRVVRRLITAGFAVRAVTSRAGLTSEQHLEWRVHDLRQNDLDFSEEMRGVQAVVHLGAELVNTKDMWRTNVEASAALAAAAERAGVEAFCYISSISVYGSPRERLVTEDTAVLTTTDDRPSELIGTVGLRTYARTKLAGEEAIRREARAVRYIVLRPTVVVDDADIRALARPSRDRRAFSTFRRTQHIYVDDVAAAIVWAVQNGSRSVAPGETSIFNLADPTDSSPLFGEAFVTPGRRTLVHVPLLPRLVAVLDIGLLVVKHRAWGSIRFPLAHFTVSSARLSDAGFMNEVGMDRARSLWRAEDASNAP